jgi:hypothetical protein
MSARVSSLKYSWSFGSGQSEEIRGKEEKPRSALAPVECSCTALCSTSLVTTRVINRSTCAATDRPLNRFLSREKMPSPVSTPRSTPSHHARCTAPVQRCLPTPEHASGACGRVIASETRSGRKISSAGPRKSGRELTLRVTRNSPARSYTTSLVPAKSRVLTPRAACSRACQSLLLHDTLPAPRAG